MEEIKVGVEEKKKTQGMRRDLGHKGCGVGHKSENKSSLYFPSFSSSANASCTAATSSL